MQRVAGHIRVLVGIIYLLALVTFALNVSRYINSPLRFDETEWPPQAAAILRHGVPKIPYAEESVIRTHPYYGYDAHYGMWHPPLYEYLLAASAAIFGVHNFTMRGVGLACFLVSLWLVWLISNQLAGDSVPRLLRALPIAFILLTPFLAEGSLFLDIDNTCMTTALLLFIWYFFKAPRDTSIGRLVLLGLMFTLCLSTKLTTPVFLLASVGLYHLLDRDLKKSAYQVVVIGVVGGGLFVLSYWLYCYLLEYPARFMFEISYVGKREAYTKVHSLKDVLFSLRWYFVWCSPACVLMLATVVIIRVSKYVRQRNVEKIDFLIVFFLLSAMMYTIWSPVVGKYVFGPVLVGMIAVGVQSSESLATIQIKHRAAVIVLSLALLVLHVLIVPPPQVKPPGSDARAGSIWRAVTEQRNLAVVLTLLAFVGFYFLVRKWLAGRSEQSPLFVALLVYLLAANPINMMKVVFSNDDRSPFRPFQDRGFSQALEYLNDNSGPSDVILAPKEIGYYFKGRYYQSEDVLVFEGAGKFQELAASTQVRYVVDNNKYPTIPEREPVVRASHLVAVKQIGDYVVYQSEH